MKTAFLSLGSNVGDRRGSIEEALRRLSADGRLRVARVSSYFETAPVERTAQPWFYNVVAEVETPLLPMQLLGWVQRVEREMGRRKLAPNGARSIDIDIVLYENFIVRTERLAIPHARMAERRFVLEPLAELAPDLRHPVFRKTVRELLAEVRGQGAKRVADG